MYRHLLVTLLLTGLTSGATALPAAAAEDASVLQPVVVVPAGGDLDAARALRDDVAHELLLVDAWFAARHPRGATLDIARTPDGTPRVLALELGIDAAAAADLGVLAEAVDATGQVARSSTPMLYVDAPGTSCGMHRTRDGEAVGVLAIWMPTCAGLSSVATQAFPEGLTYIAAHEVVHALGGVTCRGSDERHVDDDPRDVLYHDRERRDYDRLMLDPGNDDYFRLGPDSPCVDVLDSPLWEGRTVTAALALDTAVPLLDTDGFCTDLGPSFEDVPADGVHTDSIRCLTGDTAAGRTLEGFADGTFRPREQLTGGQLARVLVDGLTRLGADVPSDDRCGAGPVARQVAALVAAGIATRCDQGGAARRGVVAAWVAAALQQFADVELPPDADLFDDARGPAARLAAAGVVQGTADRQFSPAQPLTRGQATAILARTFAMATDG